MMITPLLWLYRHESVSGGGGQLIGFRWSARLPAAAADLIWQDRVGKLTTSAAHVLLLALSAKAVQRQHPRWMRLKQSFSPLDFQRNL